MSWIKRTKIHYFQTIDQTKHFQPKETEKQEDGLRSDEFYNDVLMTFFTF